MSQALVIRGGTVVNADREQRADVLCLADGVSLYANTRLVLGDVVAEDIHINLFPQVLELLEK